MMNSLDDDLETTVPECFRCGQLCLGEVLRIQEGHVHATCMVCLECNKPLATGGFFMRDDNFYCSDDYQRLFGTRCHGCGEFVEGDVVVARERTYHQHCFACHYCRKLFPPGTSVVMQGDECLCEHCFNTNANENVRRCGGCGDDIRSGQALLAMHKQWHLWCFRCWHCGDQLVSEYMGKDGHPYCERDYHALFGVKCSYCNHFIAGRVLQAGDNFYHPHCSRCVKCGGTFGEGEDMYILNNDVWHPECGHLPNLGAEAEVSPSVSFGQSEQGGDVDDPGKCGSPISVSSTSSSEPSPAISSASELSRATRLGSRRSIGETADQSSKGLPMSRSLEWRSHHSIDSGVGGVSQSDSPLLTERRKQSLGSRSLASGVAQMNIGQGGRQTGAPGPKLSSDENFDLGAGRWYRSSLGSESRKRMSRETSEADLSQTPITEVLPLDVLQCAEGTHLPINVDRTRLEEYLDDADFAKVFDMSREEFKKLQVWKRRELKKRAHLF